MPSMSEIIAMYLQARGHGTLGENLFFDYNPDDEAADTVAVYDLGGNDKDQHEIFIQIRCKKHSDGTQRIWSIMNDVLYPDDGFMAVDGELYTAAFREIPVIDDRDKNNRYLFGFTTLVQKAVTISDPWLTVLTGWTQSVLGPDWSVYAMLGGGGYPQVVWHLTDLNVEDMGRAMFKVSKTFMADVEGNGPEDLIFGVTKLAERLGAEVKILLNAEERRYLTVSDVSSNIKVGDIRDGTVSVKLSRITAKPSADAPLIMGVHVSRR